ncbi:hypothetical protein HHL16_06240 [Pseudoflavitalea sp. G-6-1-2]|uniref:lipocalin family protein n=1 Tax=Pseudoflavitalea sp. G-6-1-2 TaxID=2728841 RepID=UPI00146A3AD6|nr:lipocalin family protein [Pseudoflavitalea sp. G-6-1-2]NML20463.1 hypothetical protein [Pseudoflavitalea sp. G-6-1-2]
MKKNLLRFALISCVTLFAFSSCKKDKDDDKLAVTSENLIGNYKLTEAKLKVDNGADNSVMSGIKDCVKDDQLQLKAKNEMAIVDLGQKCDRDEITTWKLESNTITIGTNAFISAGKYEVISLTKTTLIAVQNQTGGPVTSQFTITLTRQ